MMKRKIMVLSPLSLPLSPWGGGKPCILRVSGLAFLFFLITFLFSSLAHASILNIQEITSPKGIKAWLVEDHTVSVISLQFSFKGAGGINDPDDKQGLSQLLSNTLDEGAGDLNSQAFQAMLNNYSISLGFSSGRDDFSGALKTLSKYQDKAFDLLHLSLTKPQFDKEAIDRMVESNRVRIRSSMTDPDWRLARLFNATLFAGHPYARNSGGTLTSLGKITPNDLREKFSTQLARDNIRVAIAGAMTADEARTMLDKVFGDLPATAQLRKLEKITIDEKASITLHHQDIPQTTMIMAMNGIPHTDADYYSAEIMDFIFGSSGFGSRLTEEIREKQGLTYGIYSDMGEMDYTATYTVSVSTKNETVDTVIQKTKEEMKRMRDIPVTDKELTDAKTYLIHSVPLSLTSTDRIAGIMLSLQNNNLPPDYLDQRAKILQNITKMDVLRVAKRFLTPESIKIMLVGNPKIGDTVRIVDKLPDVE